MRLNAWSAFGLGILFAAYSGAQTNQIAVTLNTSPLISNSAGPFILGFQLADGSLSNDGNNSVTVSNIQFGGGGAPDPPACSANGQNVSGDLSSSISMTDLGVFAYCDQQFTPGTSLSFDVSYTNNIDPAGLPDEFVVVIINRNGQTIPTTGGIAFLQIDFNSPTPSIQVFAGNTNANGGIAIPAPTVSGALPPAAVSVNSGSSPQSTPVEAAFGSPLGVTVTDVNGNPVSGVGVNFTAPTSGASGTFAGSLSTITLTTNSAGVASAPFTASSEAGSYSVAATVSGLTPVNFSLTNTPMGAATMTALPGTTPQSAVIGTAFTSLAVTVTDSENNPVPGVNVIFTAPGSGATGTFTNNSPTIVVSTNSSGVATAFFSANHTSGDYVVTASATGLNTVSFSLSNTPSFKVVPIPTPLNFTISSPDAINNSGQTVEVSSYDGGYMEYISTPAGFSAIPVPNGFSYDSTTGGINNSGQVTGTAGNFSANASQAYIGVVGSSSLVPIPSGFIGSLGMGINDLGQITGYAYNYSTAQAIFGTASGSAVIPYPSGWSSSIGVGINKAGQVVGTVNSTSNLAQAFMGTTSGSVLIPLPAGWTGSYGECINDLGEVAGGDESVGRAFVYSTAGDTLIPPPPGATYVDVFSRCLNNSGVLVGTSDAGAWIWDSFNGVRLLNNLVPTGWNIADGYSMSDSGLILAGGTYNGGSFEYVELDPRSAPATMTANPGTTPQSAAINTAFANPVAVTVLDSSNNPISGVVVTFTAPASGPSGSFPNSTSTIAVQTNSSGVASAPLTANAVIGGAYTVTASAGGVPTISFSLTNTGVTAVPEPEPVGPNSGGGQSQTFTFTFTDPNGYGDLSVLDVLVNNYLDGIGACYFALVPTSASTGYVFLVDDASDGGYSAGSPMPVPSGNTTANSQCGITGNGTFSGSGNTLTVTVPITFSGSFTGNKVFYTAARSSTQNSGWQALGTWNVPQATTSGPGVQGVTPSRGTSSGQTYTFSFSDTSGWQSLDVVDVLTNSLLDGIGACYFAYVPTSATAGYVYLLDDAGDGGYVSGTPMAIPGTGSLQNSQCTINASGSSATANGNVLDVNLAMTFSPSFAGNKVFFLAARDHGSGNSGWQASGLVNVP